MSDYSGASNGHFLGSALQAMSHGQAIGLGVVASGAPEIYDAFRFGPESSVISGGATLWSAYL